MLEAKTFSEMSKKEQEAFVEKRKEISRKRHEKIKAINDVKSQAIKKFKQYVHEGNKTIDIAIKKAKYKGGLEPYIWVFNPTMDREWIACALTMPIQITDDEVTLSITYSIKSPTDVYKPHVGRGLCGKRLEGKTPWRFELKVSKKLYIEDEDKIRKAVSTMISSKIFLAESHIPQRLIKSLQ